MAEEAEAAHRPAQVMRELMGHFIRQQRQAREYDEFLPSKGRNCANLDAGRSRPIQ